MTPANVSVAGAAAFGTLVVWCCAGACSGAPGGIGNTAACASHRWEPVVSPGSQSLRGIAVVDAHTVWVGGAKGTLQRSLDGGASWQDVAPPEASACDFRDVEAFDADTALAVVAGEPARVYRTEDGGRSWDIVLADARPGAFLDGLAFDGDHGVLVGDPVEGAFCVWRSADRGRTWQAVSTGLLPPPLANEACFAASGTCASFAGAGPCFVTGGSAARFVATRAGGVFEARELPLRRGTDSEGAFSVAFAARFGCAGRGIVVGGDYRRMDADERAAAFTEDGGRTWQVPQPGPGGYRSAVAWLDATTAIAVGQRGASRTRDSGRTWEPFAGVGLHAVAVGSDGSVFACGDHGRVVRLVRSVR